MEAPKVSPLLWQARQFVSKSSAKFLSSDGGFQRSSSFGLPGGSQLQRKARPLQSRIRYKVRGCIGPFFYTSTFLYLVGAWRAGPFSDPVASFAWFPLSGT